MASSTFEFQVPDDWRIARLGDILLKGPSNGIYKSVEFQGSGISIVDMKGIFANRRIGNVNLNKIELTESEKKKFLLKKGDLVFARTSLKPEGVGLCSIVVDNSLPCVYESNVIRIRSNQSIAYPEYLAQFFWSSQGRRQIRRVIRQVAATSITGRDLAAIQVPLPPLNEQKIISTLLSDTDLGIELINKAIKHFKKLKKGLMQRLLTHGIGHTKFKKTKVGEIPESWRVCRMSECLSTLESGSRPKGGVLGIESGVPSIGGEHVGNNGHLNLGDIKFVPIAFFKEMNRGMLSSNDVLVVKDGATTGKVAIVRDLPYSDMCVNEHVFILRGNEMITQEYLFHFLFWVQTQNQIKRIQTGSAQPGITLNFPKHVIIPVPPRHEQESISSILTLLDTQIAIEEKQRSELNNLKKGLMQVLLPGKVRV